MANPTIRFKRGTQNAFASVGLQTGEPAFITDQFNFYVGIDGNSANNKFFGSSRYWNKETNSAGSSLRLVEGLNNGSNYVEVKAPDNIGSNITYTLPGTQGGNQTVLTNDGSGNLSWSSGSLNAVFSGITTIGGDSLDVNVNTDFSGITTFSNATDNTLGNADTGAVQIDGGLGVNKNVTIGGNLNVQGYSEFVGVVTFKGGTINLGDSDGDNISVAGEFVSNLVPDATNTYDLGLVGKRWRDGYFSRNLEVTGNLNVDGNVTIGGTSVTLLGEDVFIKNKDIVLGYTTSITGADASTDDTANHAGVAIASTIGSPLVSFAAAGINTLPDTYKQLMWFKQGTLGFGTDAFAFNYGVAIGTTTMANGVRLAVGSNVTVTDTTVTATTGNFTNLSGSLTGTISTATRATTVDTTATGTNTNYHLVFTDNATSTNGATMRVDAGIYYNPSSNNLFATQFIGDLSAGTIKAADATTSMTLANSTGNVTFNGDIQIGGNDIKASDGNTNITLTSNTLTEIKGDLQVTGNDIKSSTGDTAITLSSNDVTIADDLTVQGNLYVNGSTTQVNTTALTVEDRTVELGVVNGSAPSSATTWDLGVLFNYNSSGAKKSAVIWEHGDSRFKFASVLGSDSDGTDVNTPQLTVTTFAPIEVAELWVNNACTGGSNLVVGCSGGELQLQNVVVDGGSF